MPRGGKREGAGRKPNPLKNVHVGVETALKLLRDLEAEKQLLKIFKRCGDARLKAHIIFRLREDAYGKPTERHEVDANVKHEFDNSTSGLVELFGRAVSRGAKIPKPAGTE